MNEPKRALRYELVAVRARLSTDERAARALAIAERIAEVPGFSRARIVAAYAALGAEVDPAEIVARVAARGGSVVYPRATRSSRLLAFARSPPGELAPGPLRAPEPPASSPDVPAGEIDAILVPCVAVASDGARLGRGGGYYDTTLPALPRAIRIGLAYEVQLVPTLPREAHDASLDAVVTEARVLLFTRGPRPQGASPT